MNSAGIIKAVFASAAIMVLTACQPWQVQEASKAFGQAAAEQLFVLAVAGPDGLEDYNDRKHRKWKRENDPYRPSQTPDEIAENHEKAEQYALLDKLRSPEDKYIESAYTARPGNTAPICSSSTSATVLCESR